MYYKSMVYTECLLVSLPGVKQAVCREEAPSVSQSTNHI